MRIILLKSLMFLLIILAGCQSVEPPPPAEKPSESYPKFFQPVGEDSQIPKQKLQETSQRYGGALNSVVAPPNLDQQSLTAPPETGMPTQLSLVLGPLTNENMGSDNPNANQSLRETIAHEFTANHDLILVDAPEERYKNDSPRPDLASRGIRYVVKGVVSHSQKSGNTTVFLRAVYTINGKVKAVASGRHQEDNQAAGEAARSLLKKLEDD